MLGIPRLARKGEEPPAKPSSVFRHRPSWRLLAYLLYHGGTQTCERTIADLLLSSTLSQSITEINKRIGEDTLRTRGRNFVLQTARVTTDTAEFLAAQDAAESTADRDEKIEHLRRAFDLVRGEFLAGYEGNPGDWVCQQRAEWNRRIAAVGETLMSLLSDAGQWKEAQAVSEQMRRILPADVILPPLSHPAALSPLSEFRAKTPLLREPIPIPDPGVRPCPAFERLPDPAKLARALELYQLNLDAGEAANADAAVGEHPAERAVFLRHTAEFRAAIEFLTRFPQYDVEAYSLTMLWGILCRGNQEACRRLYLWARRLFDPEQHTESLRLSWLHRLGDLAFSAGMTDAARRDYDEATRWATQQGDRERLGTSLNGMGQSAHANEQDDLALDLFRRARKLLHQCRHTRWYAANLNSMGESYQAQGEVGKAANCYRRALRLLRLCPDVADTRLAFATVQMHQGSLLFQTGDLAGADSLLTTALDTFATGTHLPEQARTLHLLAKAAIRAEKFGLARVHLDQARTLFVESGDYDSLAALLLTEGDLFRTWGKPDQAYRAFCEGKDYWEGKNDRWTAAFVARLAALHLERGQMQEAYAAVQDGLNLCRQTRARHAYAMLCEVKGQLEQQGFSI
jgi:tetratricopeptide (TPR) repeat protein